MSRDLPLLYLDSAATTQPDPRVVEALARALFDYSANPASQHRSGRSAKAALEDARDELSSLILDDRSPRALDSYRLIFTSGGTEANNLAVTGLAESHSPLIISAIEHPSVLACAQHLADMGRDVHIIPVDRSGSVHPDQLFDTLRSVCSTTSARPLVSLMLGNNETGIVQPIAQCASVAKEFNAVVHCDAVQCFGKIALSPAALGVDAVTVSAHKLHGPIGVGALLVESSLDIRPLLYGGEQQFALRPGSESVPLALAFAAAARLSLQALRDGVYSLLAESRTAWERRILDLVPDCVVIGADQPGRLPHITSLAFPGLDRQALLMALDMEGICCSTGSACASGSSRPSHVLAAMQLDPSIAASALRFSFSRAILASDSTVSFDFESAAQRVAAVVRRLRSGLPKSPEPAS